MKLLFFYRYIPQYCYDDWLHMHFAEVANQYPGVKVYAYGPDLHISNPFLARIKYNPKHTMQSLYHEYGGFDAAILITKSRMFMHYNPHASIAEGCWLPSDFSFWNKTPKLVLEEDYHYEHDDEWYCRMNIDLLLQRHHSAFVRPHRVNMRWFPFSVDTNTFKPGKKERINRICLAGTLNGAYPERQSLAYVLGKQNLIDVFVDRQKVGGKYIDCLQSYTVHLSGTSRYFITPAKMFEIMASGSVLFTNNDPHLKLLFPEDSYATYDYTKPSFEKGVLEVANNLLSNSELRDNMTTLALKTIKERHTHQHRIAELIRYVKSLQDGRLGKS